MTTDPYTEAACAEAERRYNRIARRNKTADEWLDEGRASGFTSGAEWARTHLAAQEPTDAEVEAVAIFAWEDDWSRRWEVAEPDEQKPYRDFARAALTAARNARRDEEKR